MDSSAAAISIDIDVDSVKATDTTVEFKVKSE